MAKPWAGITAGLLAGAAGSTALNAVTYLDQAATGDAPTASPAGTSVTEAARQTTDAAGKQADSARARALGPLGGLGIGVGVGAVAGAIRGANATPHPVVAAIVTGAAAMAVGDGAAVASGGARRDWASPANLARDLVAHLAYGAVTGYALHRMLDPHTPVVSRLSALRG